MDLSRHITIFNPEMVENPIHIIGVGATGSFVAMQLARMGVKTINIYDFDEVEIHNIPNQCYDMNDLNKPKIEALEEKLKLINPSINVNKHFGKVVPSAMTDGEFGIDSMSGFIFNLVDSMATRKELFLAIKMNENIQHYWESRLGSDQGTVYYLEIKPGADYSKYEGPEHFYSDEQAEVSACGTSITVLPIVMQTAGLMIYQFIKVVMKDNNEPFVKNYTIFDTMLNSYSENFHENKEQAPAIAKMAVEEIEF